MPRRSKGPRLWLQPARRGKTGRILEGAVWVIRDGRIKRSTGSGPREITKAEGAFAAYLNQKVAPRVRDRDSASVDLATVIAIYVEDVAHKHARPKETAARLGRILDHFGAKRLNYLNKKTCEEYVAARGHVAAARRELEESARCRPPPLGSWAMHCPDAGHPSGERRGTRAMDNPLRSRTSPLGCLALA
jgi:hypothetical protein